MGVAHGDGTNLEVVYKEQFVWLLLHALFAENGRPYRISYDVVAKSLHCMQKRASVLRKWIESQHPFRLYPSAFNPKDYRIPTETGVSRKIILCVWASETTALVPTFCSCGQHTLSDLCCLRAYKTPVLFHFFFQFIAVHQYNSSDAFSIEVSCLHVWVFAIAWRISHSCAVDFWHIVVKPRRRKTTRTYYRFWKSRWNNELRCIGFGWLRSPISINQESEDNIELLPLYHVPCVTLCPLECR